MIYFSDFSVPSGPTTDVVFAVQDFDTGTGTGTVNTSSATISGVTPKAALVLMTQHVAANDPGETSGAAMSFGLVDGSEQRASRFYNRDNNATTFAASNNVSAQALNMTSQSGSNTKAATASLVSGGVDFNITTSSLTINARCFWIAFAGADTSAYVFAEPLGTGTSAQDITTVGFQPDAIIFQAHGYASNTGNSPAFSSVGIATGDGTQRCVIWSEANGAADGAPYMALRNDAAFGKVAVADGSLTYKGTISDFDASGFSITMNASAGSTGVLYLALKFNGRQVKLVDFDTPTTTGSHTITGAGFTPQFALAVLTNLETLNSHPGSSSDNMGGWSICAIGDDEQWCASWRSDSGAATTDTGSQVSNVALMGASATDCDAIKATFTAWTSDGVTLNFSAVQGTAKKGFILFVE